MALDGPLDVGVVCFLSLHISRLLPPLHLHAPILAIRLLRLLLHHLRAVQVLLVVLHLLVKGFFLGYSLVPDRLQVANHNVIGVEALLVLLHDLVRREELERLFSEGLLAWAEVLTMRARTL